MDHEASNLKQVKLYDFTGIFNTLAPKNNVTLIKYVT